MSSKDAADNQYLARRDRCGARSRPAGGLESAVGCAAQASGSATGRGFGASERRTSPSGSRCILRSIRAQPNSRPIGNSVSLFTKSQNGCRISVPWPRETLFGQSFRFSRAIFRAVRSQRCRESCRKSCALFGSRQRSVLCHRPTGAKSGARDRLSRLAESIARPSKAGPPAAIPVQYRRIRDVGVAPWRAHLIPYCSRATAGLM